MKNSNKPTKKMVQDLFKHVPAYLWCVNKVDGEMRVDLNPVIFKNYPDDVQNLFDMFNCTDLGSADNGDKTVVLNGIAYVGGEK
jgi:hypothetical protein